MWDDVKEKILWREQYDGENGVIYILDKTKTKLHFLKIHSSVVLPGHQTEYLCFESCM